MNSKESIPLTREYLQQLTKEGDKERKDPILNEFVQQVRKIVINSAMNESIAVSWAIPENIKRYKSFLYDMLRVNFPGCDITIRRTNCSETLDISWDTPTMSQ